MNTKEKKLVSVLFFELFMLFLSIGVLYSALLTAGEGDVLKGTLTMIAGIVFGGISVSLLRVTLKELKQDD